MSATNAARLANLKVRYPLWTIGPSMPVIGKVGYLAQREGHEPIHRISLTELEEALDTITNRKGPRR